MKGVTGYNKNTFYQDIAAYGLRNTTQFPKDQLVRILLLASDLRFLSTAKNCK